MAKKITKKEFLEALENNENGLSDGELATKLGIHRNWFCELRKRYREDIREAGLRLAKALVLEQMANLRRNACKGDTRAAVILLEMADAYTPKDKHDHTANITLKIVDKFGNETDRDNATS